MEVQVNKYTIEMYEDGNPELRKMKQTKATSEEEALRKELDDKWWYDEGVGRDCHHLKYPLTFKVRVNTCK